MARVLAFHLFSKTSLQWLSVSVLFSTKKLYSFLTLGAKMMIEIIRRWLENNFTGTSKQKFIKTTLLITATLSRAPNVLVLWNSNKNPAPASMIPVKPPYILECPINVQSNPIGVASPKFSSRRPKSWNENCPSKSFSSPYTIRYSPT
ncbi:hypothetical protein D9M69_544460 [compost metagenome]